VTSSWRGPSTPSTSRQQAGRPTPGPAPRDVPAQYDPGLLNGRREIRMALREQAATDPENSYCLCYVRGLAGIIVELAEKIG
jgi:hypothetical protein